MKRPGKTIGLVLGVLVLLAAWPAWRIWGEISKARSEDPRVYESDVAALAEQTRTGPNARDGVIFVGSSSIRLWSSLLEDMEPLAAVQHGFGGAKLGDGIGRPAARAHERTHFSYRQ